MAYSSVNSFPEWKNWYPWSDKELPSSLKLQKESWKKSFEVSGIFWLFIEGEQDRKFKNQHLLNGSEELACCLYHLYIVYGRRSSWFWLLNAYCVPDSLRWAANIDVWTVSLAFGTFHLVRKQTITIRYDVSVDSYNMLWEKKRKEGLIEMNFNLYFKGSQLVKSEGIGFASVRSRWHSL